MRSNDGRPLRDEDLPSPPEPHFCVRTGISTINSYEWMHPWSRALRARLRHLGWSPVRVERYRVEWE